MALTATPTKAPSGDEKFEIPSEDNHRAAFIALVDLGTQDGNFGEKRELMVCWELLDEKQSTGKPFVVGHRYTFSLNEKANLRRVVEAALGKLANDEEVDLSRILRLPVMLQIEHGKSTKGRDYAAVKAVIPAAKTDRGKPAATTLAPFTFDLEEAKSFNPPDWLPFLYGRKVSEVIKESAEVMRMSGFVVGGKAAGEDRDDDEVEADAPAGPDGDRF